MTQTSVTGKLVDVLLATGARKATKYLSDKETIKISRICYRGKLPRKGSNYEFRITIGRPNYEEREFIRKCKKAGEPFPVKKVQLKFPKQ